MEVVSPRPSHNDLNESTSSQMVQKAQKAFAFGLFVFYGPRSFPSARERTARVESKILISDEQELPILF
jgi:hypothetical protein